MLELKKQIENSITDEYEMRRKIDLLEYEISEIEEARVCEGEINRLNDIKIKFNHRQKILSLINEAKILLNGDNITNGALSGIQRASECLNEVSNYVKEINPISEKLESLFYEASECLNEVNPIIDDIDYNPIELENVEERLDVLYKLIRKYGKTEKDILDFLQKSKKELYELKNHENRVTKLKHEYNEEMKKVTELGENISKKRKIAGDAFSKKVQSELKFLDMPNVLFEMNQTKISPGNDGCDKICFLISVNEGEPLKPMANIASGGELSRIMLAIKNVVSENDGGTIIFDEVDVGVSGNAANKIGFKLKELSKKKQVICITHLSQIAYLADEHFLIEKNFKNGHTFSNINKLDRNGRRHELARIIGGINITDTTLKIAEEMLCLNKDLIS